MANEVGSGGGSVGTNRGPKPPRSHAAPPAARGGLRIILAKIPGFTAVGSLRTPFMFQCPPSDEFRVSHAHSHTDYETLNLGQLSRPGVVQLKTVTFDSLFVDYGPPWSLEGQEPINFGPGWSRPRVLNPKENAVILEKLLLTGTPFRLVAANPDLWPAADLDMAATLRSLDVAERAGEVDARYVNVQFTEFRSPDLVLLGPAPTGVPQATSRALPAALPVGTLPAGKRTLAQLAKNYYGSSSEVTPIRRANSFLADVGNNTDLRDFFKGKSVLKIRVPKP